MKLVIEIDTTNDAFDGSMLDVATEVDRIVRRALYGPFLGPENEGSLLDINGNTVGRWKYK